MSLTWCKWLNTEQQFLFWSSSCYFPSSFIVYNWHRTLCNFKEKAMAPQPSTLAWRIPWMEEPGRLWSMGSRRVWHDWVTSLSLFTFMHWRRKWQPTPVFLPGESQGRPSLVGCRLWASHRVRHDWSDLAAAAQHCVILRCTMWWFVYVVHWLTHDC